MMRLLIFGALVWLLGGYVGYQYGYRNGGRHATAGAAMRPREVTCDVADMDRAKWVPVVGSYPAWYISCDHYRSPGIVYIID